MTRPPYATDTHLRFLDRLRQQTALIREPGWWMGPVLDETFRYQLDAPKAWKVLEYWMHDRGHPS